MALQSLRTFHWVLAGATSLPGLVIVGILGLLSHRIYFIRGEHHMKAPLYVALWSLVTVSIICATYMVEKGGSATILKSIYTLLLLNSAFMAPLFTSMLIYRSLEHPLKDFPGPRLAAVSKLWHFHQIFKKQNYILLEEIRNEYGSHVRTGPQELTVFHPDVLDIIGRHDTTCMKAPIYDMLRPFESISTIRKKEEYRARRKGWDEAFSLSSSYVPGKEERVTDLALLLIEQLHLYSGQPVNVTTWLFHFAFDVMMDMSFGRSLDLTKSLTAKTEQHPLPAIIAQGLSMVRYFSPAPWIGRICFALAPYIPIVSQKWNRSLSWAAEMCDVRLGQISDGEKPDDAFSRLILSAGSGADGLLNRLALYGDTYAIFGAGSHPTAAVLTFLMYELARSPQIQAAARIEVMQTIKATTGHVESTKGRMDSSAWSNFPYLNGCINEVLRLYPPIPTGGVRQTVDKPVLVGGRWIPPHTTIVAPRWSIGRLDTAFEKPGEFIPERWTTKPEMVKNNNAFSPFAKGRHACPGKQLGLLEVRMVAALILANFEFTLAPTKRNETRVVDDFNDGFTGTPGDLEIIFHPVS
ncbi:cytochrome P450 [Hypomontagnella monticulosa]|nr:cytochrome P450 [Hypomontagnella monticulosa]